VIADNPNPNPNPYRPRWKHALILAVCFVAVLVIIELVWR
jgi:hypothetical protein